MDMKFSSNYQNFQTCIQHWGQWWNNPLEPHNTLIFHVQSYIVYNYYEMSKQWKRMCCTLY